MSRCRCLSACWHGSMRGGWCWQSMTTRVGAAKTVAPWRCGFAPLTTDLWLAKRQAFAAPLRFHPALRLKVLDAEALGSAMAAGNSWHFGEEGELFQYKFSGRHAVHSGFTSLVLAHELQGGPRVSGDMD